LLCCCCLLCCVLQFIFPHAMAHPMTAVVKTLLDQVLMAPAGVLQWHVTMVATPCPQAVCPAPALALAGNRCTGILLGMSTGKVVMSTRRRRLQETDVQHAAGARAE
jgi:hypothetical protein